MMGAGFSRVRAILGIMALIFGQMGGIAVESRGVLRHGGCIFPESSFSCERAIPARLQVWLPAESELEEKEEMMSTESVQSGVSENTIGALAYFTLIPALVFLAIAPYNRSSYVRFHAWQSIVLNVLVFFVNFIVGRGLSMIGGVGPVMSLSVQGVVSGAFFLVWLWCVISALNGKRFELPLVGAWSWKQANR